MTTIELLQRLRPLTRSSATAEAPASAVGRGSQQARRSAARLAKLPWPRLALLGLLALTALAYTWDLSASGYANSFYAAAVQAGTKSWKAFFFGSLDSSNFITVDKPPASLWVMALSGRIFGFSSWSMLLPQALEGVAAVALLHASVKRWFGAGAGLLAGLLLAVTPVAALMFRFDNPDALLVCLLIASAYCLTRALEQARTRWVLAAGALIGLAFLAKMMQAFLVLPAFALVYLIAAPTTLHKRTLQTLYGGVAILLSAGWWVAIVALWPAGSRPMIDGSTDNSIINLIFDYNGLDRIFGQAVPGGETGSGAEPALAGGGHVAGAAARTVAGAGGANFSGPTGLLRLFNDLMGGQVSWLLPAALLALLAGVWATRRRPRTDRTRAAVLLWGGWLLVTGLVFSFGGGVIHTYYTVALAPAIAALLAIGAWMLWRTRKQLQSRALLAGGVGLTSWWSWALLDRTPSWEPWLRPLTIVLAVGAIAGILALPALRRAGAALVISVALLALISGSLAYSAQTIATAHTGSLPSAGPSEGTAAGAGLPGALTGGPPRFRGGSSAKPAPGGIGGSATGAKLAPRSRQAAAGDAGPQGNAGAQGTVAKALKSALERDANAYRWVAAVSGSQTAASLELATGGEPVMAIGGFNGNGGDLSLSRFEQYVKAREIHYLIVTDTSPGGGAGLGAGGGPDASPSGSAGFGGSASPSGSAGRGGSAGLGGSAGRGGSAGLGGSVGFGGSAGLGARAGGGAGPGGASGSTFSEIETWVESHFKAETVGGQTVYDLTR